MLCESASFSRGHLQVCLEGRFMIGSEELMASLMGYGRESVQDFITGSANIQDAIDTIQLERDFELLRVSSFVTKDLIALEKRKNLPVVQIRCRQTVRVCRSLDLNDRIEFKNHIEEGSHVQRKA